MKKIAVAFSFVLLLAGCSYDLPLADSGFVETHSLVGGVDHTTKAELYPAQIKALSEWFSGHVEGWSYKIDDIAPGTFIYLKHGDKNVAGVNLRPAGIYVASYFRTLTKEEHAELASIIGAPKD